jgi:hypothetical protein
MDNLNELFGLNDTSAEDGAKEQEPAEPVEQNGNGEEGNGDANKVADVMDQEERSRQAHGRRIRELEQARTDAVSAERARISEVLKRLGIANPDKNGAPIESLDELEEFAKAETDRRLNEGKGTAEDVRQIIREEEAKRAKERQAAEKKAADKAEFDTKVAEELKAISEYDPTIKTVDDLVNKEGTNPTFRSYINRGMTFLEAYELTHKNEIRARDRAASASASAKIAGKDHLRGTTSRADGSVDVPEDVKAQYRIFDPNISDADIRKHYNADLKSVIRK